MLTVLLATVIILSLSLSLIGLCLSSIAISSILVNPTYAEGGTSIVEDISITVQSACTISSGGGTYINEVNNGTTTEVPANTINSICNDASGYALYAIGYSGDTYTGGNNNKLLASSGSNYDIATNTSGSDSYWAMKLAKGTSSSSDTNLTIENSFDSYHTIPNTFTKVASYSTITSTTGASVDPTYKISINSTQPAGIYEGKVKYVLVHPDSMTAGTYTIAYNANGGTGTMDSETGLYNFEDHTLATNTFTPPTGYLFSGWCTVQDQTQSPQTACSGTTYINQDTIPNSTVTNSGTLNLYAIWATNTMQNVASWGKSVLEDQTVTAIDSRDNQEYTVARLKDGKLWTLENLSIDLVANKDNLNSTNTNASDSTLGYLKNGGGSTDSSSPLYKYAKSTITNWTSSYSYSVPLVNMASKNTIPTDSISTVGSYKVGGYYNYCAASAGSYCYGNGTSYGTSNGNAIEDICPKGWRMPTGGVNGEYQTLADIVSDSANGSSGDYYSAFRNALRLPLSGRYYNGAIYSQNTDGYFCSSTYFDDHGMYRLDLGTNSISPSRYASGRADGTPLRCLARE